ncbi:MAG: Holliday junction resolvase RuvX [bacterium]
MTKYLGIDYGQAHVGLAVAESSLATPLVSLPNKEKLFQQIQQIVQREGITKIVCGIPEGRLINEVTKFGQTLETKTGVEVILHPETLSTQEAILRLRESGASRRKLQNEHVYAAVLILEDYLEFQK